MNVYFIRYLWNELCVLYPQAFARGYKTHNSFYKYRMKWTFISDPICTLNLFNTIKFEFCTLSGWCLHNWRCFVQRPRHAAWQFMWPMHSRDQSVCMDLRYQLIRSLWVFLSQKCNYTFRKKMQICIQLVLSVWLPDFCQVIYRAQ